VEWKGDDDCAGDIMIGGSVRTLLTSRPLGASGPPPKGRQRAKTSNDDMRRAIRTRVTSKLMAKANGARQPAPRCFRGLSAVSSGGSHVAMASRPKCLGESKYLALPSCLAASSSLAVPRRYRARHCRGY
jgi:hypothetical protein